MKVLVTGATGFIGGALARRLVDEEGAVVTASGRDLSKAWGLDAARLEPADLLDAATMETLVQGQEVVFHVGAWLGQKDDGNAFEVNVTATESLVRQAAAAGVRLFVLVSSVAVYGVPRDVDEGPMDESRPLRLNQPYVYGATKAQGDARARALGEELGMKVVVVRPGMVHGPGGEAWTRGAWDAVQKGLPVLLGRRGCAYTVYIDNLLDLMLLVATSPEAEGAYNAVDAVMSWSKYFGYFADAAGVRMRRLPWALAKGIARAADVVPMGLPINTQRLAFYRAEPAWPMDRAEALGWEARVSEGEGFVRGVAWVRGC